MEAAHGILSLILLFAMVAIYFLPSIIAVARKHKNATPIFIFNLFLAWTIIGWIAAIIWSTTHVRRNRRDESD